MPHTRTDKTDSKKKVGKLNKKAVDVATLEKSKATSQTDADSSAPFAVGEASG